MFKHLTQFCLLCLLGWLACVTCAMAEGAAPVRHFIMGGSADNLGLISKQEADTTFNVYLSELYKEHGLSWALEVSIYPDVTALLAAFDKGEVDGYFGTPLDYLARKDQLCKTMVAMRYRLAPLKQSFLIVARADEGVTKIGDLKNKRLSMAPYQDMEALYLNTTLLRNGLPEISAFFSERRDIKSTNIALMDVFFKKSDVTVVRENEFNIAAELNPQLAKKLIILDKSLPMFTTLGVVNKKYSEQEYAKLITQFLSITQTEKGKKVMSLVQVESGTIVTGDDSMEIEEMLREQGALRKLNVEALKKVATPKAKIKRNAL